MVTMEQKSAIVRAMGMCVAGMKDPRKELWRPFWCPELGEGWIAATDGVVAVASDGVVLEDFREGVGRDGDVWEWAPGKRAVLGTGRLSKMLGSVVAGARERVAARAGEVTAVALEGLADPEDGRFWLECERCGGDGKDRVCRKCDGCGEVVCVECGHEEDCDACLGTGGRASDVVMEGACRTCGGKGWVARQMSVKLAPGAVIQGRFLAVLGLLPGAVLRLVPVGSGKSAPLLVEFEGGVGVVMPMRDWKGDAREVDGLEAVRAGAGASESTTTTTTTTGEEGVVG